MSERAAAWPMALAYKRHLPRWEVQEAWRLALPVCGVTHRPSTRTRVRRPIIAVGFVIFSVFSVESSLRVFDVIE